MVNENDSVSSHITPELSHSWVLINPPPVKRGCTICASISTLSFTFSAACSPPGSNLLPSVNYASVISATVDVRIRETNKVMYYIFLLNKSAFVTILAPFLQSRHTKLSNSERKYRFQQTKLIQSNYNSFYCNS